MFPIHRVFKAARQYPEAVALVAGEETLTYTDMMRRITAIRLKLRELETKFGHQERVGVLTGADAWTYCALLALLAERSAYVPLNRHNPDARNLQVIEEAGISILLVSKRSDEVDALVMKSVDLRQVVGLSELDTAPNPDFSFPETHTSENLAYLLFTSGSTGKPKGVPIHWGQLDAFVKAVLDAGTYDFRHTDRFLQMFELTFDLSIFSYLVPLCVGASVYVLPDDGMVALGVYDMLEEQRLTVALMVPSVLGHLAKYLDEIELPHLRWSLFCGEALPHSAATQWAVAAPNARIENVYGPTEATIFCTRYPFHPDQSAVEQVHGTVPIGKPLPAMSLCVIDAAGKVLPEGQEGELCLMGPQVTTSYWENPDKTAASFITIDYKGQMTPAYRTGDLARVNPHGNYVFLGRNDSQVKIEGYRIELGEIEHHVREFIGHPMCAVVPVANAAGQHTLHLFVEERPGLDIHQLFTHLRHHLPTYMLPRETTPLGALPLNLSGKVDRAKLKELAASADAN